MKKKILSIVTVFSAILILNSCNKVDFKDVFHPNQNNKQAPATVATDWYKLQLKILLERNSALNGAYFAYIGIGLYEAARFENKKSVSLSTKLYQMPPMPAIEGDKDYDWEVSANAAMASLVKSYFGGLTPANLVTIDSLENAYNLKLKQQTSDAVFNRSQSFGKSIASVVYNWSLTDNFNPSNVGYTPKEFTGAWVPTPPAYANGVQPFIGKARPLFAGTENVISGPFPAPYSENTNSAYYKIVKQLYDISKNLTQEQKDIALFWVDQGNGVGYTPPGHDFSLVTQAIIQEKSDLGEAAEVYAKAGIAEREASIICFRSKYEYSLIRPVTVIQKIIEPGWLPFIGTPPHPEFPAAHAFITGTVMNAVSKVLGDHVKITDHTYDFRGWKPRSFTTLVKAAEEAGISRLYGGIHYQPSINIGLSLAADWGSKIGNLDLKD